MMARIFRGIDRLASMIANWWRIRWLKARYPGLYVGRDVVISPGARIVVVKGATLRIADRTFVGRQAHLHSEGQLEIGADGFVGNGAVIVAAERIVIGSDALIAERVTVRDQDHGTDLSGRPFREQVKVTAPVEIGRNVWLGAGAVVLRGVAIGDGCVIGANAVVTRSLGPRVRAVGVPARPRS